MSIYAQAEKTMVDGIVYFDRAKDITMRKQIITERNRLLQKMLEDKKGGAATMPATATMRQVNSCDEEEESHGLLTEEAH